MDEAFSQTALIWVALAAGLVKYPSLPVPPGDPEAFPVQMGYLIPPVCSGSVLSLLPVGRVQKNLHREKFGSDGQNLKLVSFNMKEQRFHSSHPERSNMAAV